MFWILEALQDNGTWGDDQLIIVNNMVKDKGKQFEELSEEEEFKGEHIEGDRMSKPLLCNSSF